MVDSKAAIVVVVVALMVVWVPMVAASASNATQTVTVVLREASPASFAIVPGYAPDAPDALGTASLQNSSASNGWYALTINMTLNMNLGSDAIRMEAAGFVEGWLTGNPLGVDARHNFGMGGPTNYTLQAELNNWFDTWSDWLVSEAQANSGKDPYWAHVGLVLGQMRGLVTGYNAVAASPLNMTTLMELSPSIMDIISALTAPEARIPWTRLPAPVAAREAARRSHCSAFIRDTGAGGYGAAGHATWNLYTGMLRIWKEITVPLQDTPSAAATLRYSSYPLYLFSGDDYLTTDAGLVIMETTNNVFNTSLYDLLRPTGTVPTWMRSMVASRMAGTAQEWAEIFSRYNSGTYNNQWMAVSGWPKDVSLWIVEQAPGLVVPLDVTNMLNQQSYWPSYNIPYTPEVYDRLGYPAMAKQFGDAYVYAKCPRAQIFKRNATLVHDDASMQALMRYNNWKHDPLSLGSPANAVASRFDLLPTDNPSYMPMGAIDAKCVSRKAGPAGSAIISGPTHAQQPVFQWNPSQFPTDMWPRWGQNQAFPFGWVSPTDG